MRIKAFILAFAVLCLSSCGVVNKFSSSSSDFLNGSSAGTILTQLASEYFKSGKVDFGNAGNILNIVNLASTLGSLKGTSSSQAVTDFTGGLQQTLGGLVNKSNIGGVVDGLSKVANLDLTGIANSVQKGNVNATDVVNFKSGIEGVLGMFNK